jgi:hypothetical protein
VLRKTRLDVLTQAFVTVAVPADRVTGPWPGGQVDDATVGARGDRGVDR